MTEELPKLIYHYTNLQGLRGIVKDKCLYMTNVYWMDDTKEMFWFREVVMRLLERRPADERDALHQRFENILRDRSLSDVFCTCFSEHVDSRSQWLEYADDGNGFAIGFDPTTFELKRGGPTRDVELKRVIYDEATQEQMAEQVIQMLQQKGEMVVNKLVLFFCQYQTWWDAALCKNPAFVNEKEWRLIYRDDPGDSLAFRERGGRHLIPFIRFPFDPSKDPIREVWLGARNQSQRNVDAVAQLLRLHAYDADQVIFRGSNVPLRPDYR